MKLALQRIALTDQSTCGNLFVNDALECWTLEEAHNSKVLEQTITGLPGTCIAAGTYKVVLSYSPRFSSDPKFVALCVSLNCHKLMPEVLDVPNRTDIRIHWGNTAKDTHGCVLLGKTHSPDFIGGSREAFAELYEKMVKAIQNFESITLEVLDPPGVGK